MSFVRSLCQTFGYPFSNHQSRAFTFLKFCATLPFVSKMGLVKALQILSNVHLHSCTDQSINTQLSSEFAIVSTTNAPIWYNFHKLSNSTNAVPW
jgi:hypothetical protein